jgi:hypothetical protein
MRRATEASSAGMIAPLSAVPGVILAENGIAFLLVRHRAHLSCNGCESEDILVTRQIGFGV